MYTGGIETMNLNRSLLTSGLKPNNLIAAMQKTAHKSILRISLSKIGHHQSQFRGTRKSKTPFQSQTMSMIPVWVVQFSQ